MNGANDIIFSEGLAFLPGINAVVQMPAKQNARVRTSSNTPATTATSPAIYELNSINDIAYWGDDNLFPQTIVDLASKSTELPSLLDWKARAAQGAMVLPYERVFNEVSKQWEEQPIQDREILDFFLSETTKRYYREAYNDFYWFWNVFPDLIKNDEGDKIVYIGTHEATWCRWYKQNEKGIVEKAAIGSNWGGIMDETSKNFMPMPVLNPYDWNLADNFKADTKTKRAIYPVSYPSPNKSYYQLAPWDGFRTSGWMALAASIPEFKKAIMNNAINPKYKFCVPTSYWAEVNKDWDTLTFEQKTEKKKAYLREMDAKLTGAANAGKTLLAEVSVDIDGKVLPGWDIELLENTLQDGAYLEDSQEASAHLLRALSLDGTLVGQGPGRNLNAGGGADKLIAYNMYVALLGPQRQVVDEPVYFIARYNGWYDAHPFFFIKTIEASPQALDTSRKVSDKVQEQWPKD